MQAPKLASLPEGFKRSEVGGPGSKEGLEPMLLEQWRKRWMGAKEDEQIQIGPLIGRGGYGKVFKGAAHALSVVGTIGIVIMMVRCRDEALDWAGRVGEVFKGEAQALR